MREPVYGNGLPATTQPPDLHIRHPGRLQPLMHRGVAVIHHVALLPHTLLHHLAQSSVWEQPTTAALFAAGAVVGMAAPRWWLRRRRLANRPAPHARATIVSTTAASVVATLLAVAVAVNSYAGYAPSWDALWGAASARSLNAVATSVTGIGRASAAPLSRTAISQSSVVVRLTAPAPQLHIGPRPVFVYLPPGYFDPANADVRYPVLYLLHGYPGHASDWLRGGNLRHTMDALIAGNVIRPLIVVMPQDNAGFFDDSECLNLPGGQQNETYLTATIVSRIDRTFRTIPDRTGRAIGGMSAGAFCALNLGLRHLDEYAAILASEPYADPGRGLIRRAGGISAWRANSPRFYLPTMALSQHVSVFLDAGARDRETLTTATWLAGVLARRGQYVALRIAPNQSHTWTAARMELPYSLVFATQHLANVSPPVSGEA